jgi:carboxymethylenebutenolidase
VRVNTSRLTIEAPDGAMPAFLAEPSDAGRSPAVLVLIEAFGLVPSMESVARRLAREGYIALVPDLFYREIPNNTAAYDDLPRGMELMAKLVRRGARFLDDIAAAFVHLEKRETVAPKRLGVTGFCMGGALAFAAACAFPDRIAAAAPFYGGGIVDLLDRADRTLALSTCSSLSGTASSLSTRCGRSRPSSGSSARTSASRSTPAPTTASSTRSAPRSTTRRQPDTRGTN